MKKGIHILGLFGFYTLATLVLLVLVDRLFFKPKSDAEILQFGQERFVLLKEGRPNMRVKLTPSKAFHHAADNLERKPYMLACDERGYILPSKLNDIPDFELVFLGGSTTQCTFNDSLKRFAYLAGRLIEEKTGKRINSYNHGSGGAHSGHSLNTLLNKVVEHKPNYVVLMHAFNDFGTLVTHGGYWQKDQLYSNIKNINTRHKTIGTEGRSLLRTVFPGIDNYLKSNHSLQSDTSFLRQEKFDKQLSLEECKQLFRQNLLAFVQICKAYEITPIIMTQPHRLTEEKQDGAYHYWRMVADPRRTNYPLTYNELIEFEETFNQEIRTFCSSEKVILIDMEAEVPKQKEYMYDAIHFTDKGCEKVAEVIANTMVDSLGLFQ
ncbi:MAG: SGNH/GDSL hydrolase family protein [Bacteroidetes bacterium]|nr:SGNH/GDSL hydrolase family protein [Bacteroidota bacterium]